LSTDGYFYNSKHTRLFTVTLQIVTDKILLSIIAIPPPPPSHAIEKILNTLLIDILSCILIAAMKYHLNVTHLLNVLSARVLEKLPPNSIKFGVGVPNVLTFPFKKISVELITGENINLQGQELSDALQYLPSVG